MIPFPFPWPFPFPTKNRERGMETSMRTWFTLTVSLSFFVGPALTGEPAKQAPKVVLKSADGKKEVDLAKLVEKGPVLVRLTCACSGCDQELPYFQKLQDAYNEKGLQTVAVFQEKPEAASNYAVKKGLKFQWLADPKREMWKTFDAKTMPTNILIDKGGKVVKVVEGCTRDGKNAQTLSAEVARLLKTHVVQIAKDGERK
jgi:peroxiredoxin